MCYSGWEMVAASCYGYWKTVYPDPTQTATMSQRMSDDAIAMFGEIALPDNAASKLHCTEWNIGEACGYYFDYTVTE